VRVYQFRHTGLHHHPEPQSGATIRSHNPEPQSGAIVGAMIRSHGSAKLPALVDGAGILYRRAAMASITQLFVCPQDWQSAPSGVLRLARLMGGEVIAVKLI
jgi:hypothetical protein